MRIAVKVRGKPEAVLTVLRKLENSESDECSVVFSVSSHEELMRLISLSIENGVSVEIVPEAPNPAPNPSRTMVALSAQRTRGDAGEKREERESKQEEIDMLAKYKRRAEQAQGRQETPKQEEAKKEAPSPPAATEPKSKETKSQEVAQPTTQATRPQDIAQRDRVEPKTEPVDSRRSEGDAGENLVAKAEELSQEKGISFEELVKLKEEAFSRKIVE